MASNLLRLPIQALKVKTPYPSTPFPSSKTHLPSLPISLQNYHPSLLSLFPQNPIQRSQIQCLSLGEQSSNTPPTTKEEAILQARTCLSLSLQKPLNNPRISGKLKKLKQPRLRVEIPVVDDSPESLTQLGFQLFSDLPIQKRGAPVKILILWPNPTLSKLALATFESEFETESSPDWVQNSDLSSVAEEGSTGVLRSADVAILFAPDASQLEAIKMVSESFYPKPVVVFNPKWGFEEESGFGKLGGFVGSFEVVYAFMGLEVRGILSKRKGVVFRCVSSNVNEGWVVLVEEKGELKVISRFMKRPSVGEVENVLYNVMAVNSPVTKSFKFIRDLVSNVSGKKER